MENLEELKYMENNSLESYHATHTFNVCARHGGRSHRFYQCERVDECSVFRLKKMNCVFYNRQQSQHSKNTLNKNFSPPLKV